MVGTFQIKSEDEIFSVVDNALKLGYRSFDTARVYKNEHHLGPALKTLLPKHNLTRTDVFITSKLGPKDQGTERSRQAILKSQSDLQLSYIDLYLVHWPGVQGIGVKDGRNRRMREESWIVMEEMCRKGLLRNIGVSNYTENHLSQLLRHCAIKPALLQAECHPRLTQTPLRRMCQQHDIPFQAYSSLGTSIDNKLLRDELVGWVGRQCGKSPAQVLLRWALQQNIGVIPKTTNHKHMRENIQVLDFELSNDHITRLSTLNADLHYCWDPNIVL